MAYTMAFQVNNGQLWTYTSNIGPFNTTLGMMSGTSPSLAIG
jgi:hypothetical protein